MYGRTWPRSLMRALPKSNRLTLTCHMPTFAGSPWRRDCLHPVLRRLRTRHGACRCWSRRRAPALSDGTSPRVGPQEVEAELWFGVLAEFVAWDKPNGFPVALISAYDVQGAHALASVHATLDPALATLDVCVEILPLFVQYVFNCWLFRKIYIRYASADPELDRWHAAFQSDGRSLWERVGVQVYQLNVAGGSRRGDLRADEGANGSRGAGGLGLLRIPTGPSRLRRKGRAIRPATDARRRADRQ